MRYKRGGQTFLAAIGSGFVEADASKVRVISEFFARPEDIDQAEARSDLEEANQKLKAFTGQLGEPEQVEAQKDLDWAQARLEVLGAGLN
jgi:F0F1-type ATP synthase epsilon subunit